MTKTFCNKCGKDVELPFMNEKVMTFARTAELRELSKQSGKKSEMPTGNLKDGFILSVVER